MEKFKIFRKIFDKYKFLLSFIPNSTEIPTYALLQYFSKIALIPVDYI